MIDQFDFVALDVETANSEFSSICQIGLVFFKNGVVVNTYKTYIHPETYFDAMNVSIHGIDETTVKNSPIFPVVLNELRKNLTGNIVVHHTGFDRASIRQAVEKYKQTPLEVRWLDTARAARKTWEDCRHSGYGLSKLAERFSIVYVAHDALEDARASGELMLRILEESKIPIDDWTVAAYTKSKSNFEQEGNPYGPLTGNKIVFTGALNITRSEASHLAADAGCEVQSGVNKDTTILVVGNQDLRLTAGQEKSSKHRKAEELIAKGRPIRIVAERDFLELIKF